MSQRDRDVSSYTDSARKKLSTRAFRSPRMRESDPDKEREARERDRQADDAALFGAVEDLIHPLC